MDSKLQRRFTLGRQSSLAPENDVSIASAASASMEESMDSGVRLMYLANEGDLDGIQELLDSGTTVNFKDIDGRTALHVAACQGLTAVVDFLLRRGAGIDVEDRWGSTVCMLSSLIRDSVAIRWIFLFHLWISVGNVFYLQLSEMQEN